jgi:hypothetical protein
VITTWNGAVITIGQFHDVGNHDRRHGPVRRAISIRSVDETSTSRHQKQTTFCPALSSLAYPEKPRRRAFSMAA